MGRDMLIAFTPAPVLDDEASEEAKRQNQLDADEGARTGTLDGVMWARRRIQLAIVGRIAPVLEKLSDRELNELGESNLGWGWDELYDEDENETQGREGSVRILSQAAEEAVVHVIGENREVMGAVIQGRRYLLSGGPSWGDSPTQAYDDIWLIDDLGITYDPITLDEYRAAVEEERRTRDQ